MFNSYNKKCFKTYSKPSSPYLFFDLDPEGGLYSGGGGAIEDGGGGGGGLYIELGGWLGSPV